MTKPPMRPLPPRPPGSLPPPPNVPRAVVQFGVPKQAQGHRVVLYGPGGIGKTSAASWVTGPVAFVDLDESLSRLNGNPSVNWDNIKVLNGVETWAQLREALRSDGWDSIKTIVIDTMTKAEELAVADTLEKVMADGGKRVTSVEGYGYGKGFTHVFETFLAILGDLDRHCRAGRNVVLICHDCTCSVPNPSGEDWLRYEPRLQSPSSGKASIRLRSGTRTLWTCELPHCMAKSRTTQEVLAADDAQAIWAAVLR
jgi:hypothetical protein